MAAVEVSMRAAQLQLQHLADSSIPVCKQMYMLVTLLPLLPSLLLLLRLLLLLAT
jgi:hypothetical protein